MRARLLVLGAALALAAGCATEAPPGEASLELGTGSWRFEPVTDGDTVSLVRGAQGGWHFWLSLRAQGMSGEYNTMRLELQPADESAPAQRNELPVYLEPPDEDGVRLATGLTAILADPGCAVGELLRVRVTMTADDGTEIVDERYLMIDPGPDPPPACGEELPPGPG